MSSTELYIRPLPPIICRLLGLVIGLGAFVACDANEHPDAVAPTDASGAVDVDANADSAAPDAAHDLASDSSDDSDGEPACQYGYDDLGICCDDRLYIEIDGERVPVSGGDLFMRFEGCPCDPALPVASGWWCADALISQAMVCGYRDLPRRWIQGTVERSDFDGPPLECTWELLASHTGEYPDQGL